MVRKIVGYLKLSRELRKDEDLLLYICDTLIAGYL